MAAGRPVVAAVNRSSQAAALIKEAKGGVLVEPEDPVALASAIQEIQLDQARLKSLGELNRAYAETHFDRRRIMSAQEEFLIEVIAG
jgi:colanic acid biosynthesis glycosyl transferase WcaI